MQRTHSRWMLAATALIFSVLTGSHPLQARPVVRHQQQPVGLRDYVRLIGAYRSEQHPVAVQDLARASIDDLRDAVRRTAHAARALNGSFGELNALDALLHAGELEAQKYFSLRRASLRKIERIYQDIGLQQVSEWSGEPRQDDVGELARGAVGLHTALAAMRWRDGHANAVPEQTELAITYIPDLLATLDKDYIALWCRTAGTLLTGSDRYGAAVRTYDRCLEWSARDPWILLGRGSSFESSMMLVAALPADAILLDAPRGLRDEKRLLEQAVADYQGSAELPEAGIRLARLRLETGDPAGAVAELLRNRAADLEPVLQYWRALVYGAAENALGRPQTAVTHYRLALKLYPMAQTAAIALGHTLAERLGQRDEAVDILRQGIHRSATRTFASDPWWLYRLGQARHASTWLAELHRLSRL